MNELNFFSHEKKHDYTTKNLMTLLAESMGIKRTNKIREYILTGEIDTIMAKDKLEISNMEYSKEDVRNALKRII